MKRFFKTSALLTIGLFLLASGFDAALDRMARCTTQSSFTIYNEKGAVVVAYQGDLDSCKAINRPVVVSPNYLHRG